MKKILLVSLVLLASTIFAQKDTTRNWSLKGYPVAFFTPETSFGFGAFGAFQFQIGENDSTLNYSQIQLGAAYTLENQILTYLPFRLFWDGNKNYAFGEVGYFRYFFYYYGIGNETPTENEEIYQANFPRIRLHYSRRVFNKWSVGGTYWFEDYRIPDPGDSSMTAMSFGGDGGITSGFGPLVVYDSRDDVFYPRTGYYFEGKYLQFSDRIGSDYDFGWGSIDFMRYFDLGKNSVLATHINQQFSTGDIPFNMMSMIGGTRRMRGYREGRHRDRHSSQLQVEYRHTLPWRLGFVAFADIGKVYSDVNDFGSNVMHWTAGGGLRWMLDKERKINIRVDYGVGKGTSGFYFTIGEAF
ncbi:MAG: BamA/TamA family outer membrane protein [Crocinitomicaceae bacterium]|nr:BamA/TamA family outer membrane protein [Crocinitomicaceae bacterium]